MDGATVGQQSGWCGTSASMGQESAQHGLMRYCGRDHCFKLLDLARTKGSLCGWGRGLWRWGAVLGESHGSCPFRRLDMTRARSVIERNEKVTGLMSCWNVGLNSPAGYHE
ncbi:hypothetical protein ACFXTN_017573 [Malus domestica]